jgi:HD domain
MVYVEILILICVVMVDCMLYQVVRANKTKQNAILSGVREIGVPYMYTQNEENECIDREVAEARAFSAEQKKILEEEAARVEISKSEQRAELKALSETVFNNEEIMEFFTNYILPLKRLRLDHFRALVEILKYLDANGNVPSVVDMYKNDPDQKKKSRGTYGMLSQVTLITHTLNSACEYMRIENFAVIGAIAMLCHDIGKCMSKSDACYETDMHPSKSVLLMRGMKHVKALPEFEMIENAVRLHHVEHKDNYFASAIREADGRARAREIDEMRALSAEKGQPEPTVNKSFLVERGPVESIFVPNMSWYSRDEFVAELAKCVNTRIGEEGFWSGIDVGGYCFFKPEAIWTTIEKIHPTGEILTAGPDTREMYIRGVIDNLNVGDLASELLPEGACRHWFDIYAGEIKKISLVLIPLRSDIFNDFRGTFRGRKSLPMKQITEIRPQKKHKLW